VTEQDPVTDQDAAQDWVPIVIAGELDLYSAPDLREQVLKAVNTGRLHIVLDLSDATFVDSSGFAVMVSAYKRVRALDGTMRVVCADKSVLSALRISGLDRVFEVFPDMAAATSEPPSPAVPPAEATPSVHADGSADA
jgi:anti-sigma B factor antagonist